MHNSAHVRGLSRREIPSCFYFSGFIAYLLEAATGKKVGVKETLCIIRGDPHCMFEVELLSPYVDALDTGSAHTIEDLLSTGLHVGDIYYDEEITGGL